MWQQEATSAVQLAVTLYVNEVRGLNCAPYSYSSTSFWNFQPLSRAHGNAHGFTW